MNLWGRMMTEALGLWPGTRWLFACPVSLLPFLGFAPLVAVFGGKLFIELRLPHPTKLYKGLWPGDIFLGFGIGGPALGLVDYVPPSTIDSFWSGLKWDVATAIAIFLAVVPLAYLEYSSAIRDRRDPKPWTYTVYQLHTPTCLLHRAATAFAVLLIMKLDVVGLTDSRVPLFLKAVFIAGVVGWGYHALYLDNTRPRPADLDYIHPPQGVVPARVSKVGSRSQWGSSPARTAFRLQVK